MDIIDLVFKKQHEIEQADYAFKKKRNKELTQAQKNLLLCLWTIAGRIALESEPESDDEDSLAL